MRGTAAPAADRKHSDQMGFDHQGRSDLNVLYWVAHIPDREPVLSIEREKIKKESVFTDSFRHTLK